MTVKILLQKIRRKLENLVTTCDVQSRIHSDYDSAESIADLDLEDGELRKMLLHRCIYMGEEKIMVLFKKNTGKLEAEVRQKREESAQRDEPDHSRRERDSLMSNSSQEPRAYGKPDAMFSLRSNEPGNQFERSMFKNANPSNLGKSLLEGKGHLLSQARSELMRQEHQVGSLNSCISELQQQAFAQRLELQDAQHGQIRSMREMRERKRAQELRVDEFPVRKLREKS